MKRNASLFSAESSSRTCTREALETCQMMAGVTYCYCKQSLCNNPSRLLGATPIPDDEDDVYDDDSMTEDDDEDGFDDGDDDDDDESVDDLDVHHAAAVGRRSHDVVVVSGGGNGAHQQRLEWDRGDMWST